MVTEISLISVRSEIPFLDPAERILLLSSIFKTGLIRLSSNNLDALQTISDTELIHTVMKSKETFIKKIRSHQKLNFLTLQKSIPGSLPSASFLFSTSYLMLFFN